VDAALLIKYDLDAAAEVFGKAVSTQVFRFQRFCSQKSKTFARKILLLGIWKIRPVGRTRPAQAKSNKEFSILYRLGRC